MSDIFICNTEIRAYNALLEVGVAEQIGGDVPPPYEKIRFITDCDDTLVQTYANLEPMPGAEEFLKQWGSQTVLITVGSEANQVAKLATARLPALQSALFVGDAASKADMIEDIARRRDPRLPMVVAIGDRLDNDITPARKAGLVAVRMRHPGGKYYKDEPQDEDQNPTYTVSDFVELMKLPIF